MKVLQTLGRKGGAQEGIFQYRRGAAGVLIDASVGQANLNPNRVVLTHGEWRAILDEIQTTNQKTLRLTGQPPFAQAPNRSLYHLLRQAVPSPAGGWSWNNSWKAYVCAILEHEGSIDLYHGTIGQGVGAHITLKRDAS